MGRMLRDASPVQESEPAPLTSLVSPQACGASQQQAAVRYRPTLLHVVVRRGGSG